MTLGMVLLVALGIIILLGVGHRVLDRLGLTDAGALAFLAAILVGGFIELPIARGRVDVSLNVGGGLIPVILAVLVITRAPTAVEKARGIAAALVAWGVIFGLTKAFRFEEGHTFIDPIYVFGVVAAAVAYLTGRSRRAAFAGAVLGIVLLDVANAVELAVTGMFGSVRIGGGGALDSVVVAALVAVILCEVFGESLERIAGGSRKA